MSVPRHTAAVGCRWLFVQYAYVGKRQQRYKHGGEEWPSFIVATTMHRHMSRHGALSLHRARPTEKKRRKKRRRRKPGLVALCIDLNHEKLSSHPLWWPDYAKRAFFAESHCVTGTRVSAKRPNVAKRTRCNECIISRSNISHIRMKDELERRASKRWNRVCSTDEWE